MERRENFSLFKRGFYLLTLCIVATEIGHGASEAPTEEVKRADWGGGIFNRPRGLIDDKKKIKQKWDGFLFLPFGLLFVGPDEGHNFSVKSIDVF